MEISERKVIKFPLIPVTSQLKKPGLARLFYLSERVIDHELNDDKIVTRNNINKYMLVFTHRQMDIKIVRIGKNDKQREIERRTYRLRKLKSSQEDKVLNTSNSNRRQVSHQRRTTPTCEAWFSYRVPERRSYPIR